MRYIVVVILLIAVGVGGWFLGHRSASAPSTDAQSPAGSADSSTPPKTIVSQGKLVPAGGLVNVFAPVGERIEFLVDKQVGDSVNQGEVLIHLASRTLRGKDRDLAIARRDDALKQAAFEKEQAGFKRDAAQLAVEEAESSEERIRSEEQKLKLLDTQLETAQTLLERLESLDRDPQTTELINQTELAKQRLMVKQLQLQREQGKVEIKLARGAAERARKLARNSLATVEHGLASVDDAVPTQSLDAGVELAQTAYDLTEIKSPIDGKILDIIVRQGDSATNRPVMVLGNTDAMHCQAEVNDTLLRYIDVNRHANLRARITSPALGQDLWGTVINRGVLIAPPSLKDPNPFASVDRRTGTVIIDLDDDEMAAKLVNLQVDVEIEVAPGTLAQSN